MSHLFATALLLTLSAGSAGLLAASNQSAQFHPGSLQLANLDFDSAESALAQYSAQTEQRVASAAAGGELVVDTAAVKELDQPAGAIAVNVCLNLPDWQRPSEAAQLKQLESMPNYSSALETDPLADIAKAWWDHTIFSFTTYGLSARTDPLYLSGVWTALDDIWNCYDGDQPEQINRGELAEMWLLHHRLVSLEWRDGQYLATVESVGSGLQLVQFPRQESGQGLPLSIVTTTGEAIAVMSGDW